jgi:general secretion pathway protein D
VVKPLLGTAARVVSNPSLGALTIIGTVDQLALAERVVELNDKARGEVLVDVQIMEVNRSKLRRYGIDLANYEVGATYAPFADPDEKGVTPPIRAHILSSLNLSDFVVHIPTSILAKFLQTEDNSRILASPRLRASEGKPATLSVGTEVPIPVTTFTSAAPGLGGTFQPATSFQYRTVGVTMKITPRVNASGEITLEVAAEFSLLGGNREVGDLSLPTFLSRKVEGVLRVRDGETSLIGGLLQSREAETLSGALGVLDIPVIKNILSDREKVKEETEVLISLTPHLVRAPLVTEADLRSLYVGTQEAVRVPSAHPPLFGPLEEPPISMGPGGSPEGGTPTAPTRPGAGAAPGGPAAPPPGTTPAPQPTPPVEPVPGAPPETATAPAVPTGGLRPVSAVLSPADASLKVGETASIAVVLMNARDLTAVEFVMTYDPAFLEAVDIGPGTLLTLDGSAVGVDRGLEAGRVRARLSRSTGVAGSGVIASVAFRGLRPGPAIISVDSVSFTTTTGADRASVGGPARITVVP